MIGGASAMAVTAAVGLCYAIYKAVKWIHSLRQNYKTFERIGVAGPKPIFLLGNALEFMKKPKKMHEVHADLIKKYGRVTGLFMGVRGRYLLTDPDIIKEITVKQFSNFLNRSITFNTGFRFDLGLLILRDDHWKKVRNILTPNFTSNKMKNMRPLLDDSTRILMQKLDEATKTGEPVNIWEWFGTYTMQIIMATAFGTDVDSQTNSDNILNKRASQSLHLSPFAVISAVFLPALFPLMVRLDRSFINGMGFIDNFADKVLSMRKKEVDSKRQDIMQIMIDASDESKKGSLTHDEAVGQIITVLLAGYETTNNALGYIAYLLALHPEVQDKLINEIESAYNSTDSKEIDYDIIMYKMAYLDMVISESLRLYPPVMSIGREIKEDCVIKGVKFLKGLTIGIPAYAMHRDPEFWEEPEKFDPERFSEERKNSINTYAYLPFGIGPRACIGSRFALMEIKLCLVKVLMAYRFVTCPETQIPLQVKSAGSLSPQNGIYLKIEKR